MNAAPVKAAFAALAATLFLTGCAASTRHLPAITPFDVDQYLGRWYEIARLPHRFERGLDYVTAEYSREEQHIAVVNRGVRNGQPKSVRGVARFKGDADTAELRVSFFRPFYGDYRVIWLAPDYSCAIVTSTTKKYFWILARERTLPPTQLQQLVAMAQKWGFETEKLEFPRQ